MQAIRETEITSLLCLQLIFQIMTQFLILIML